jgi:uncharacterized protein HemX
MHRVLILTFVLIFASSGSVAFAQDRLEHFKGKSTETIKQARANLSEYHRQLVDVLAESRLSPSGMAEIHKITYTLENALKHMAGEIRSLQEQLEKIHLASERNDSDILRAIAPDYLATAGQIFE